MEVNEYGRLVGGERGLNLFLGDETKNSGKLNEALKAILSNPVLSELVPKVVDKIDRLSVYKKGGDVREEIKGVIDTYHPEIYQHLPDIYSHIMFPCVVLTNLPFIPISYIEIEIAIEHREKARSEDNPAVAKVKSLSKIVDEAYKFGGDTSLILDKTIEILFAVNDLSKFYILYDFWYKASIGYVEDPCCLRDLLLFFAKEENHPFISSLMKSMLYVYRVIEDSLEYRYGDEKNMESYLSNNFSKIFPEYEFVKRQYRLQSGGVIDILAKNKADNRPVIIELKIGNKNPQKQLFGYATEFENPILVAVTEEKCTNEHKEIIYKVIPKKEWME